MDYKSVETVKEGVVLEHIMHFNLADIFDNGQCFRWDAVGENHYSGVAFGKKTDLIIKNGSLYIENISTKEFHDHWEDYLDLKRDYGQLKKIFSTDETLAKAIDFAPGLRLLKQQPWEALLSFILSQNNNIKRIKGLVERFCETFGSQIDGGYAFPTVEQVRGIEVGDLEPVRAGFRARYIVDAVDKVDKGQVSLTEPFTMELTEARKHLMQIVGVGPKVADCVLLFGFNRIEAVPVDVWMKRALERFYPNGFPKNIAQYAGIAQQYIFHYTRLLEE